MKLALVGPVGTKTSIGTYCEALFPEIQARTKSKIFTEYGALSYETQSWKRHTPLEDLADQVSDSDAILIQHSYGLFDSSHVLDFIRRVGNKVFVNFHSVFNTQEHASFENTVPYPIVHNSLQLTVLANKGVKNIRVIPHGYWEYAQAVPPNIFNLFSFGFTESYKGWEDFLRIAALVKNVRPVKGTCFFSDCGNVKAHNSYIEFLERRRKELGLDNEIKFVRGFRDFDTLKRYVQESSVVVLPYLDFKDKNVYATSGAARFAISCHVPVVTSDIPMFSDLNIPKGKTVEEMAYMVLTAQRAPVGPLWSETAEQYISFINRKIRLS